MSTPKSSIRTRLVIVGGALALGAAAGWAPTAIAGADPPSTEPPGSGAAETAPPIAAEEWTRLDPETPVRGSFTDDVTMTVSIGRPDHDPVVVDVADLSHLAVARFTVQPGAQFPWHTHAGPVLVSVVAGELVYVMADDCAEHSYQAGSAFVDAGHGEVHSAYNPTDAPTVIVATFLEAPADGPLVITDGIAAPSDGCGMASP